MTYSEKLGELLDPKNPVFNWKQVEILKQVFAAIDEVAAKAEKTSK